MLASRGSRCSLFRCSLVATVEWLLVCRLPTKMKEAAIASIPGVKEEDPRQLFDLAEKLGKVRRGDWSSLLVALLCTSGGARA